MKNSEFTPGLFTDSNLIKDRVIREVSTYRHLSVSETGHAYLKREAKNRPASEDAIRGIQ